MNFGIDRDGSPIEYWDPVISTVTGSLAEERRTSSGRLANDLREFKLIRRLNKTYRVSLYEIVLNLNLQKFPEDEESTGSNLLSKRLSHLGARYPNIPGIGLYIKGIQVIEGERHWKKLFDLLHFLSSSEQPSWLNFFILEKFAKIVNSENTESHFKQKCAEMIQVFGIPSNAKTLAEIYLENRSAIRDSMERGKKLSKGIFFYYFDNTSMYRTKVRRRGYSRSTPVQPKIKSKKTVLETNHSLEVLTEEGILKKFIEGGYVEMNKPRDTEEILQEIFENSLETFLSLQKKYKDKGKETPDSKERPNSSVSENSINNSNLKEEK